MAMIHEQLAVRVLLADRTDAILLGQHGIVVGQSQSVPPFESIVAATLTAVFTIQLVAEFGIARAAFSPLFIELLAVSCPPLPVSGEHVATKLLILGIALAPTQVFRRA